MLVAAAILLQLGPVARLSDPDLMREARAAQRRFELFRRTHVPMRWSGGPPHRCDARVGRYCYWYDTVATRPVPEPKPIGEARGKLLGLLDSAGVRNSTDAWIVGQRIRYLIEANRLDDALTTARTCAADAWWCHALEGLALHVGGRYVESDSAFTVALRDMPAAQRCEWFDLTSLIDGPLERELARAACDARPALVRQLWTLAQPLWTVPGNDLRTEHFARLTMEAILARSANAHGMSWSEDSRELLVRYGWSEWFTRTPDDFTTSLAARPSITGHDREPSYYFFPGIDALGGSPRLSESSWRLREPMARSRYAPRYLKKVVELPHQLARFPRGDSMWIAVMYRIADTALAKDSLAARIAVMDHERITVGDGSAQRILRMVPRDTFVASIEVRGSRSERVARARYTVDPLLCVRSWCLSDLLLFDASSVAATVSVDSAITRASDLRFRNVMPLGVYWEIEGDAADARPVFMSLTVTPKRVSAVRRLATQLKLAPEITPVRLNWPATFGGGRRAENVTLRLPRSARGQYRVLLTVELPGVGVLSSQRDIELLP